MSLYRIGVARAVLFAVAMLMLAAGLRAQPGSDVAALRDRLREHFDILALQDGVGLVPKQRGDIRVIEIRNGLVSVDGRELTGRELRERLGDDAQTILRITYLDAADQRALAAGQTAVPPSARAPEPSPGATQPPPSSTTQPSPGATQPPPSSTTPPARPTRRSDIARVGADVHVARDEIVSGDVAAVMGSATVDGEVKGDVTVVMGSLRLGPEAVVHGDVTVVGGALDRAPTARVDGEVTNVGFGSGRFGRWAVPAMVMGPIVSRVGSLVGTIMRVAFLALLALIAVAIGGSWVERIADHAAADPLRAGLIGFFAELALVPGLVITVVVLAISIIGIPLLFLLPFAILFLLVVLLVGFTGVAYQVGRMLNARAGWADRGPYATVAVGVVLIAALTMLARSAALAGGGLLGFPLAALGFVVEYAAWTIGFGCVIQVWLQRRRRTMPPPLPA